ncbi:E3 Ufm1-Protein Ligase 1 [Manis pentadactyla]|nr:E3 Ufm1-Protein Ligase 1 [Manis pentadactyla]
MHRQLWRLRLLDCQKYLNDESITGLKAKGDDLQQVEHKLEYCAEFINLIYDFHTQDLKIAIESPDIMSTFHVVITEEFQQQEDICIRMEIQEAGN